MASDRLSDSGIPSWEIEEGLPQFEDPFIQQYLQGREALIEQEKAQRSDYAFRQTLTPLAAKACAIVSRIRAEEQCTVWTGNFEDELAQQKGLSLYPGMMFALAKKRMEKTESWHIVSKMPKGALLHAHFDAMIDADWLIDQVLATEGMAMVADQALYSAEARESASISFQYSRTIPQDVTSVWIEDYQAKQLVPVKVAANTFPDGGRKGFRAWLDNRCTITQDESLNHHHGVDAVWRKFQSTFPILDSMIFYEPIFRAAVQRLLHQLLEDGLRWADFRIAFIFKYRRENHDDPEETYDEFFNVFREEVKKFQATEGGERFWGCRFIWTTLRRLGKKEIVENMKQCISMKSAHPDLIAGFDLVGQEDMGRPLADLAPELFWFRKRCVESQVDIPFFFHAGECLGDGDETDQNLFDAILLGTRRIGHGFSLYKHPLLIEMVKQKKILIESCPISNEILHLTSSIKSHPLPALLAKGVTVALCNDDPVVLGHGKNGVTHDFWQALQGWENLGLEGLGSLAENSVRYAAYTPDQTTREWNKDIKDGGFGDGIRASRLREWTTEWNKYCEWIVMEYAAEYGDERDN